MLMAVNPEKPKLGRPFGTTKRPEIKRHRKPRTRKDDDLTFSEWCAKHLRQSVDVWAGKPLDLEPWQVRFMDEATERTRSGHFVWSNAVLIVSRKNGKTMLMASYALWHLMTDRGSPEVLLAAASDRQAGRLFEAVTSFFRRSAYLRDK